MSARAGIMRWCLMNMSLAASFAVRGSSERQSTQAGSLSLPAGEILASLTALRQYAWLHAACLRQHADPSIPLLFQFWDDYDGDDGRSAEGKEPAEP